MSAWLHSWSQTWRLGYDVTSGFRVPNASEVYFTLQPRLRVPGCLIRTLKAERSTTHTLSLQGRSEKGTLDANLYQSNYRNFLSEEQKLTTSGDVGCNSDELLLWYLQRSLFRKTGMADAKHRQGPNPWS